MRKLSFQAMFVFLLTILSLNVCAQENQGDPNVSSEASRTTAYTQGQLGQMLAPIALYPDALLAQILMAATYPREVVEAARWLQDADNAALHGDQLMSALQDMSWDSSIKALVAFPDVVQMMNDNLQWTEQLGDAFIGQEAEVMDEIQRLRKQALDAGTLQSSLSQSVTIQDGDIVIESASPDVLSVPLYDPTVVYGTWPYPNYPPDFFSSNYLDGGPPVQYGVGIPIMTDLFFFHHLDFRSHRIDIDEHRFRSLHGGRPPIRPGRWTFDPRHRENVPHHAQVLQENTGTGRIAIPASQRPFRGSGVDKQGSAPQAPSAIVTPAPQRGVPVGVPVTTSRPQHPPVSHVENRRQPVPERESHTSRVNERSQSARGQASRSEMDKAGEERGSAGSDTRPFGGSGGHR